MSTQNILIATAFRVKEIRLEQNLSQEDFGYQADLDRTHICKIENARMDIKLSTLCKICETSGISLKDFFDSPYFEQKFYEQGED